MGGSGGRVEREGGREGRGEGREGGREGGGEGGWEGPERNFGFPPSLQPSLTASYTF